MGGTAYETKSERLRREGGEEMQAKMQIVLDEKDRAIEQKDKTIEEQQKIIDELWQKLGTER